MSIIKELNSLNQKNVYDLTKFTTTDYEGHLSCIVWLINCNFKCLYCYNDDLVFAKKGNLSLNEVLLFLKKRVGLLDAVVISGGEATVHNLTMFCQEVKKLGFKIKLDTNGTNLQQIKSLTYSNLIDYMAIDFKAPKAKYYNITKTNLYDDFIETIKFLLSIDFNFELRTTVNSTLLDENDLNSMIKTLVDLGYENNYYLQNFLSTSSNIGNIQEGRSINKSKINSENLNICWRN